MRKKWKTGALTIAIVIAAVAMLRWHKNVQQTKLGNLATSQISAAVTGVKKVAEKVQNVPEIEITDTIRKVRRVVIVVAICLLAYLMFGFACWISTRKHPDKKPGDSGKPDIPKNWAGLIKFVVATCLLLIVLFVGWKTGWLNDAWQSVASNSRPVSTVTTVTRTRAPQVPKSGHAELWVDDQHWEEFEILHEDVEIHHFTDGPVVIIPPHGSPVKSYPKEVTMWPKDTQRKGIWRVQALNPGPRFRDTWTWD